MKNLIVLLLALSQASFGITAGKVWRIPTAGTQPTWGPINLSDATNAVTGLLPKANLAAIGQQTSSGSSTFSTASTSYVDVTNLTVTITTGGRPVWVGVMSDPAIAPSGLACTYSVAGTAVTTAVANVQILRASTVISNMGILASTGASASPHVQVPCSSIHTVDPVGAGTYTYKVQVKVLAAGMSSGLIQAVLMAYEM